MVAKNDENEMMGLVKKEEHTDLSKITLEDIMWVYSKDVEHV